METAGAKAEELKAEGNQLYKDEKYFQASVKYTEAINADDKQATYFNNRYKTLSLNFWIMHCPLHYGCLLSHDGQPNQGFGGHSAGHHHGS